MSVKFLLDYVDEHGKSRRSERFDVKLDNNVKFIDEGFDALKLQHNLSKRLDPVDGLYWVDGRKYRGVFPIEAGNVYKAEIRVNSADFPDESETVAEKKRVPLKPREMTEREKELDVDNLIPVYVGAPDFPKTPMVREVITHRGASVSCVLTSAFKKGMIPIKPEGPMKQINAATNEEKIVNQSEIAIPEHIYVPV
ncbi:unnamed protein product [Bursaphelenchus xylophilus]|uniref:(pine wood nematode) hypothetical protein n=1 Tax=Bursaphelenchus xylophilus TaxID=6326 RepID=A0A1I7SVB9_BURXY|nr:unnamed protein product [Bursaphelenchus xylophilus]CAG9101195.1 unnamed protein product [Bursaphelenchus xylophilus]